MYRHHAALSILIRPDCNTIKEKLLIRLTQAAAFALVFPGELAFHPDIGPALAAAGLVGAALEGAEHLKKGTIPWAERDSPLFPESAAAGLGWPSNSQRSRKCCCAAERSESWAFFHLAMNSCGVMKLGGHESVTFA